MVTMASAEDGIFPYDYYAPSIWMDLSTFLAEKVDHGSGRE